MFNDQTCFDASFLVGHLQVLDVSDFGSFIQ